MNLRRMPVMPEALQDEVRSVDGTGHPAPAPGSLSSNGRPIGLKKQIFDDPEQLPGWSHVAHLTVTVR
jgi:hypothetical protein